MAAPSFIKHHRVQVADRQGTYVGVEMSSRENREDGEDVLELYVVGV